MEISDIYSDKQEYQKIDSAYWQLTTVATVEDVYIILTHEGVKDKTKISGSVVPWNVLWWLLKKRLGITVAKAILHPIVSAEIYYYRLRNLCRNLLDTTKEIVRKT